MAGVVSSEGVFETDLSFSLAPSEESSSLQDLIDSELALRSQDPLVGSKDPENSFTTQFLTAERTHSDICNGNAESESLVVVEVTNMIRLESPDSSKDDIQNETESRSEMEELASDNKFEITPMSEGANEIGNYHLEPEDSSEDLIGLSSYDEPPCPRVLEMNRHNTNLSAYDTNIVFETNDEPWTTVEEAARDMLHKTPTEDAPDFVSSITDVSSQISDSTSINETLSFFTEEPVVVEKKTKKKKSSQENGETVTIKTKKTKKTKKSEEKENHISVIKNGYESPRSPSSSPAIPTTVIEDDLSNVCVKELKNTYVNEASKIFNSNVKYEEPVLPPVPIRELRRSFGDIHKACQEPDLSPVNRGQQRARSLGDLCPGERPPIVTGVNVKELKSSFSKFDQLSKKDVLHVRSSGSEKAQKTFSQAAAAEPQSASCKSCGKTVFAMEQIKAERAVWHKNCFRCKTCNKQLTVDIYSSHEGELYCKPHFKELFQPKAVIEENNEPVRRRKPEMIIRESQPVELPPDVVRASDKSDLGLEELSSLDVKSRFHVFERQDSQENDKEKLGQVSVKRSPSILSKLARFQKKGMNVGVSDDSLNGFVYEETSSSEEEEDEEDEEENGIVKCRKVRERPLSFSKMDDVKKNWESGQTARREELREKSKQDIQNIRSRMFMGHQGKMKELYEQAVAESEVRPVKSESSDVIRSEKAKIVKEKFEKGIPATSDSEEDSSKPKLDEDMRVFEEGMGKKSRSIFLEMDANAAKTPVQTAPVPKPAQREGAPRGREVYMSRQISEDVVKASDKVDDVVVETADLSSKFRFFETYQAPEVKKKTFRITPPRDGQVKSDSPDREIYRDPDVVRSDDKLEDEQAIFRSQTASKMLSIFRQMEEQKETLPDGPKPKKCFTPPPDYRGSESSGEESDEETDDEDEEDEEEEDESDEDGVIRSSYKMKDEFLEKARNAAKAKELAAKFESWEPEKHSGNNAIIMLDSDNPSIDSTKSLCARFESLRTETPKEKSRPKVNRFVEPQPTFSNCAYCDTKVYPLERVETGGKIFHKGCFRCTQCKTVLRMDSYTLNNGQLYCMPHFKQLFISKGNYDEGFGITQHKRKWEASVNGTS